MLQLYKSGIVAPMLKCISREQGIELLSEMHAGMCEAHRGPHEIAHKAIRPILLADSSRRLKRAGPNLHIKLPDVRQKAESPS